MSVANNSPRVFQTPPPVFRVVRFDQVSEEEYFARDAVFDGKIEYYDGELVALDGASPAHNDIAGNTGACFHRLFWARNCRIRLSRQRVHIVSRRAYTYPDVVVSCDEARYQPRVQPAALLNPALLIEVLSPSTALNDRSRKLHDYQSIPGLLYYLLLESECVGADLYAREPGTLVWTHRTFDLLTDVVPLPALGVELPLAEAYVAVIFGEGEETE